jgi:hypothetical protein
LTPNEMLRCFLWAQKLKHFKKVIGRGLYLGESVRVVYLALKLKDPFILNEWMRHILTKISYWKHRTFFYYIRYLLRHFFWSIFSELQIKGIKFQLKGKVSVTGNARKRTVVHSIGHASRSTINNKILHSFSLINTFTGVLGFQIWLIF